MKELIEISSNYAMERSNDLFSQVVAQAYADGYRDGYKDREEEIPVDLRGNKTEYVDLGLPSGTLWSKEYEKTDGNFLYLPYLKAKRYNIPTREKWEELVKYCRWAWFGDLFRCTGRNGETIDFRKTGRKKPTYEDGGSAFLWLLDETIDDNNAYAWINNALPQEIEVCYMGYNLPIRQVR